MLKLFEYIHACIKCICIHVFIYLIIYFMCGQTNFLFGTNEDELDTWSIIAISKTDVQCTTNGWYQSLSQSICQLINQASGQVQWINQSLTSCHSVFPLSASMRTTTWRSQTMLCQETCSRVTITAWGTMRTDPSSGWLLSLLYIETSHKLAMWWVWSQYNFDSRLTKFLERLLTLVSD